MNDELLVKYLLGEITPEEQVTVKDWISANDTNRRYFEQFQLIWDKSRVLAATSTVNENAAWLRFQQRINNSTTTTEEAPVIPIRKKYNWMRAAAILVLVVSVLGLYFLWNQKPAELLVIATRDHVLADTLPDGSVVTLNRNSSLTYPEKFKGRERLVDLKGEGFFNVKADKSKPFIVHINDITVSVVGTSFNIKNTEGKTEIIVETGIVRVSKAGRTTELKAGDKLFLNQADSVLSKEKTPDKLYNYYRSKEFVCNNTPLWKLVDVLNEAYDANIVIESKDVRSLLLTTTFDNESLDNILDILSKTFEGIVIEKKENKIIIK
jgi:ferric-dicitrate binding protein FerR (iron transport regulator)